MDRCVDDIAYTLVVQRDALNVVCSCPFWPLSSFVNMSQVGAAKGLIAGSLTVHMSEDVVIDYSTATDVRITTEQKQYTDVYRGF